MSPDFGGKPWSLVHYVCLKSAIERVKPTEVLFHCEYQPSGPWWELARPFVTVNEIRAPREIFGRPLLHPAHQADVVRLERLLETGGIYLDADVLVHRSFNPLLSHSAVLGEERTEHGIVGLCNAVILSEAHAPFLQRWLEEYRSFRSAGHDEYWDEHSVKVPYLLSQRFPAEVTVLSPKAFFWPTFQKADLAKIYDSVEPIDLRDTYATHLWESPAWDHHLEHLTPQRVRGNETNFHSWARPFLQGLPDDYGAPTLTDRAARGARRLEKGLRKLGSLRTGIR